MGNWGVLQFLSGQENIFFTCTQRETSGAKTGNQIWLIFYFDSREQNEKGKIFIAVYLRFFQINNFDGNFFVKLLIKPAN